MNKLVKYHVMLKVFISWYLVRTIIDIGGQDAKAIKLDANGNVIELL